MLPRWRTSPWDDPVRKLLTLDSFARTEEDAGRDIANAARVAHDPELVAHLERHARDERRHAELFRARAAELRAAGVAAPREEPAGREYDLVIARGAEDFDGAGLLGATSCARRGELAYVALLHVVERRAEREFERHLRDLGSDARTALVLTEILRDERYHVAYTRTLLERWRRAGRGAQVARALAAARGAALLGAWKRLGARSAAGAARALLLLSYCTWIVPFGLAARRARPRAGWQAPRSATSGLDGLRAEY